MNVLICPDRGDLVSFATGRLDDELVDEIASHLEACDACRSTLEEISDSSDPLAVSLRQHGKLPFSQEPALQKALEFVQEIGLEASRSPAAMPPGKLPAQLKAIRDYEILEKLGEGGMGAVYKARHNRLKKIVAIKVLPADRMEDPHAVARFEREMEAVGKLEHPNIVRAMDAGEADGTHFLVMEYVAGSDLSHLVRQHGLLPIAGACELIRQAALGLHSAHEHGLVHRDIKPSNLILSTSGTLKILDLGLALLGGEAAGGRELTTTGQMMGTLDYMAPEQGSSSHKVDIRADIYSLGATLYKLLTGQAPFGGEKYSTPVQKMMALATETPAAVESLRPDVPPELAGIVTKMLARDPNSRYSTPAEVAHALQPFAQESHLSQLLLHSPFHTQETTAPLSSTTDKHLSNSMTGTVSRQTMPEVAARTQKPAPARTLPRFAPLIAGGLALLLLTIGGIYYGITILIKNKKGKVIGTVELAHGTKAEIQQDGKKIVEVDAEKRPPRIQSYAPDRRAAEWMLSINSKVGIKENGKEREVNSVDELPRGEFELAVVNLQNNPKVTDEGLAHFMDCQNIISLNLGGTRASDAGLVHFKGCNRLEHLHLYGPLVGDVGLAHFGNCPNLLFLHLAATRVSDTGLATFKNCKFLSYLDLGNTGISSTGLRSFRDCKNLATVGLHSTKASDDGLAQFRDYKNLAVVDLGDTQVTDAGLAALARCPKLISVNLKPTKVTEAGVKKLSAALPQCKIEWDGGVKPLFFQMPGFDQWVKVVAAMSAEKQVEAVSKKLVELNPGFDGKEEHKVEDGAVTELRFKSDNVADISPVRALVRLSGLACASVILPSGKLADLSPLKGMQLAILACHGNRIHDLSPLAGMKLVELNCGDNPFADLSPLKGMPLRSLNVGGSDVSELSMLQEMPLNVLSFNATKVTDLSPLKGMALTRLFFQGNAVVDLSPLEGMPLETLNCGKTQAFDLSPLKGMPLTSLYCFDTPIADPSPLQEFKNLTTLNLSRTKVIASGVTALQKALPNCKIEWDDPANPP